MIRVIGNIKFLIKRYYLEKSLKICYNNQNPKTKMNKINCKQCNKEFFIPNYRLKSVKFCSRICHNAFNKGKPHLHKTSNGKHWKLSKITKDKISKTRKTKFRRDGFLNSIKTREKISIALKGKMSGENNPFYGKKHTEKTKIILRKKKLGISWGNHSEETKYKLSEMKIGEKNPMWKGGQIYNKRNDPAYSIWVRQIKKRDKYQCQFKNENCFGYLIIHHILPWSQYPEERYNINNGITLCQYHHPKKRIDEQKLIPIFQNLIELNK